MTVDGVDTVVGGWKVHYDIVDDDDYYYYYYFPYDDYDHNDNFDSKYHCPLDYPVSLY